MHLSKTSFLNASKEERTARNPRFEGADINTIADSPQTEHVDFGTLCMHLTLPFGKPCLIQQQMHSYNR
jgi:hypothetical protein